MVTTKKGRSAISQSIYKQHLSIVKDLNNAYIFVDQALAILGPAKDKHNFSDDRRFAVPPSKSTNAVARRTGPEIKAIYDKYLSRDMLSTFIVAAVSRFEAYLFDVLRIVFTAYPEKLTDNVQGIDKLKNVPIELVLSVDNYTTLLNDLIAHRVESASYAKPIDYLTFFSSITGIDISDDSFSGYLEIKASRDLIIHNSGLINSVYLKKAGQMSRGTSGETITIDSDYYSTAIGIMKRISGIISREADIHFPSKQVETQ